MFATHPRFMIPVPFGDGIFVWKAVELDIHTPWLFATVMDPDEPPERTFLLSGSNELLDFVSSVQFGGFSALHLVQPPIWSKSRDWGFVRIRRIERFHGPSDNLITAVMTAYDGVRYGGYPIEPLVSELGPLDLVAEIGEE